ncbi:MAG TPA: hypothetical protein VF895_04135 [Gaiellaceae bacterium]
MHVRTRRRLAGMDVDIEGNRVEHQGGQAGFLDDLAQGDAGHVRVAVAVAAGLQPALELRMPEE